MAGINYTYYSVHMVTLVKWNSERSGCPCLEEDGIGVRVNLYKYSDRALPF